MDGIMYQGYTTYLQAYQRHTAANYYSSTPSLPPNSYDKKERVIDPGEDTSSSYQPPALSPVASVAPTCDSPDEPQVQNSPKTEDKENPQEYADAQYISANCVVLTYFNGDLTTAIEEHFTRALAQDYSKEDKERCPLSQRNFPASFWNSSPHSTNSSYESLYADYSGFHALPQPDPWTYNLTASQSYNHHRAMSDFPYMPSSSRYPHNYTSLLMGRPRFSQCVMGKSDHWSSSRVDDSSIDHSTYTHFQAMTGLDSPTVPQDHGKDLYWF